MVMTRIVVIIMKMIDGIDNEVNHVTNNEAKKMFKKLIIYAKSKGFVKSEIDLLSLYIL